MSFDEVLSLEKIGTRVLKFATCQLSFISPLPSNHEESFLLTQTATTVSNAMRLVL